MATRTAEYVIHFAAVRLRVDGTGNLQMRLLSPNGVKQAVMVPLAMTDPADDMLTKLVNFKKERAQLEFKTTEIDEVFDISRILIFTKPVASSYPG